jgi:hypothetical protein
LGRLAVVSYEPLAAYVPAETGRSPGQQWKARAAVALLLVAGLLGVEAFLASQSSVALTGSRSCTNSACTTPAPVHSASAGASAHSTTGAAAGATGASSWYTTSGGSTGATTPGSGRGSNQSASADPGSSHGSLALTGIQVAILVIVALALLTAGGGLLVSGRRRRRRA